MSDGWHPKFLDYLSKEYQRMMEHYHKDPSFKEAVQASVGADHPTPQAVIAAQATQNANQIAQANPPPKQPWDGWSDEQKARMDRAIALADGIKLYRSAGGLGQGLEYAQASQQLAQNGGIPSDQALLMARYRAYRNPDSRTTVRRSTIDGTAGGDVDEIQTGPREPLLTPEQKALEQERFFASSYEGKTKLEAENRMKETRQRYEGHFDDLAGAGTPAVSQPLPPQPAPQPQAPQEPGTSATFAQAPPPQEQGQPQ